MKNFKVQIIKFKDWEQYEEIVNALYFDDWEIVETLARSEFPQLKLKEHTVRLKAVL